ncbi:Aminopeptidase [Caenorhabditis elegans]|nr:Aminopeptidase [Caenorhabditis elegans]CCG28217.1 Aminopeptidase [Caenorhabditis elegans]|eukprot:NP_001256215.1 Aminopeptidase-like protein AC3.5 [Caenorhabditis elegans]
MMQFKSANESMTTCKNFTRSHKKHQDIVNEEDADENASIKQPTKEELALPKNVQPVWYDVSLSPKVGGNGTMGLAHVKLNIEEPTNKIVLNAKDIEFTRNLEKIQLSKEVTKRAKKSVDSGTNSTSEMPEGSGEEAMATTATTTTTESTTPVSSFVDTGIKVTNIEFDENLEKVTLTLDQELKKGSTVVLKIPFTSKVSNNNGLKEYKYKNSEGKEQSMFTTQPSYSYLRHVFPSFDQEAFKAPAAITLMHSKGSIVVANTGVKTKDDGDAQTSTLNKVLDPDFVIGDLVASEVNTTSGITIRIWTRPEVKHSTEQSLDYANQAIDAMEHILQSRLESKSLDIVAVPGFQTGNRVSPSFIVLPEEDILYNEQSNDINQKTRIARMISNRIAAQWFGGITNPEEFGTFWLNEALPRFLEVEALEKILDINSDDLWTYEMEKILERDATATSQPLRVKNVFSSADIAEIDHEFIGKKGAAVLRMIQKSVGVNVFNKAIRSFVSSYRSAYPYDDGLWKSFEKALGGKLKGWNNEPLDVAKFVNTWVDQIGFPLVSVEKLDDETVELSQERFKNDHKTKEQFKFRNAKYWFNWEVPLFLKSSGPVGNVSWLHEAFRLPLNTSDSIYLNTDSNGVYRVNYEEKRWNDIAKQLEKSHGKLSERTRARLISDVFALANSGALPFETALNVTSYLPMETATVPWLIATRIFKKLTERLEGAPIQDKLNSFIYQKIHKKFEEISSSPGEASSNYLKNRLYANLLDLMAIVKPEKSNEKLNELFVEGFLAPCQFSGNFSSDCSEVPGDLREKVYCNGVEFGNDTVFETVRELAEKEVDGAEKDLLQNSLACFRDPRALRRLILDNLNSTSTVTLLLRKMNSRPVGKEIATNWIIDNWSTVLKKKFKNDPETLNAIADAGIILDNEREKSMIETFMEHHHKSTHGIESLDKKIEEATTDIYWRKQKINELNDYLDGKMKGPAKDDEMESSEEQE